MPRGDGRGPAGMGPASGRGAGLCAGFDAPGFASVGRGAGWGFGRGGRWLGRGGRGFRHGLRATGPSGWERGRSVAPEVSEPEAQQQAMEQQALEQEARVLESSLERVRRRLDELGKDLSQE